MIHGRCPNSLTGECDAAGDWKLCVVAICPGKEAEVGAKRQQMTHIAYRTGFKYQLAIDYWHQTALRPKSVCKTEFLYLDKNGWLLIKAGYAWDGPSGPTFDTPSSMRGSLVHDALYQLMRLELLQAEFRNEADQELYTICVADKMWKWRAKLWRREVSKFAGSAADPKHKKQVYLAPR